MIVPYRLEITDFATTQLRLNDNIQFASARFAPTIAQRQRAALARGGPYVPVPQTIEVDVLGDTAARCWANLATLLEVLDSADRWWHEDAPGGPLCLLAQTTRQSLAVSTTILGYIEDDQPLTVSEDYQTSAGPRYALVGVRFTVLRGGGWESDAEAAITSSAVANPGIMSVTFPTTNAQYSRVRLSGIVDGVTPGFARTASPGFLILASDTAKLQVNTAGGFSKISGSATVSSFADAAAVGGALLRTTAHTGITKIQDAISFPTLKRRVALFAAVRNNSLNTFFLRAEVVDGTQNPNTTPVTTILTAGTIPQIVYLGMVTARYDLNPAAYCNLYINAASINAGDTLDLNYVCLACLDDPWTDRTITIGPAVPSPSGVLLTNGADILIEPGTSVGRTPYPVVEVLVDATPTDLWSALPYQGDPYIVVKGTTLAAVWLSTEGGASWMVQSLSVASNLRIQAQRARAYRVPPGAGES